jgi:hypothetical protein
VARSIATSPAGPATRGARLGDQAEALGVSSAVSLGAAIPLLLVVIVGATWFAGWRLRALRLTSDE